MTVAKVVSCSRTETAGRRCCCWGGRGGRGTTAARRGLSAQGEAKRRTERGKKEKLNYPNNYSLNVWKQKLSLSKIKTAS